MARGKTEAAASKLKTATGLGALGGSIGGPIGAGIGAVTGLIIGDDTTVFPIDMVAIPAYQAYLINGNAAITVYIKAGETLVPTGGNVLDMSENMDIEVAAELPGSIKRRRKGAGLPKKYAKMGFKKG
ncbi:unnamed protein product, partial [marine sediment metagenome]